VSISNFCSMLIPTREYSLWSCFCAVLSLEKLGVETSEQGSF
jgi:hypothetical protein